MSLVMLYSIVVSLDMLHCSFYHSFAGCAVSAMKLVRVQFISAVLICAIYIVETVKLIYRFGSAVLLIVKLMLWSI